MDCNPDKGLVMVSLLSNESHTPKPCPFCGSILIVNEKHTDMWIHSKNDCFFSEHTFGMFKTKDWNKRFYLKGEKR